MKIPGPEGDKLIPQEAPPLKGKDAIRKAHRLSDTKRAPAKGADKVEISARAKELSNAKKAASEAPEVRLEKVKHIKKAIEEGSYKVDAVQVAEKILKENLFP